MPSTLPDQRDMSNYDVPPVFFVARVVNARMVQTDFRALQENRTVLRIPSLMLRLNVE